MLGPVLHHRRKTIGTIFVSTSRPRFCARGSGILPHINKLGTSDLICSNSSTQRYAATQVLECRMW